MKNIDMKRILISLLITAFVIFCALVVALIIEALRGTPLILLVIFGILIVLIYSIVYSNIDK